MSEHNIIKLFAMSSIGMLWCVNPSYRLTTIFGIIIHADLVPEIGKRIKFMSYAINRNETIECISF